MGLTLRYPYEVRDQAEYFEDIPELLASFIQTRLAAALRDGAEGNGIFIKFAGTIFGPIRAD